ncbi:hypothetical protein [Sorangium sp. So ce1099]|uniref:hypothetical protein n=1 Tax=Sorangium sp. So ce1099 TaxID=3133331 RepID=UPI003F62993D
MYKEREEQEDWSVGGARVGRRTSEGTLPWIQVAPGAPYFVTEDGAPWAPIGHNDAITWPELAGLFRRRDLAAVEAHLRQLREHGVTVLRLMLEYCHREHRYIERPAGRFVPAMVRLWDDLFALCEKVGIRVLLTPFDTFFLWVRWQKHPYNRANGGPCANRTGLLLCPDTRRAMKERLAFAARRWGGSGALFAWDLWNELHPVHGDNNLGGMSAFVSELSEHVRGIELALYGRAHPQTVSVFGPELLRMPELGEIIFRHPALDLANSHFYEEGTIDDPQNTVDAAISAGKLVRAALGEIRDSRPFFDSEHGPIHTFKDHHRTLPEPFDDEYFRHIQWAHLASGGAGGGMRWPNRHPHVLTPGMRRAQRAMADFLPLLDWPRFRRRNLTAEVALEPATGALAACACGDDAQAVVWLVRTDSLDAGGMLRRDAAPARARLRVPGLAPGRYAVTAWDTARGEVRGRGEARADGDAGLVVEMPPVVTDVALAIRRAV